MRAFVVVAVAACSFRHGAVPGEGGGGGGGGDSPPGDVSVKRDGAPGDSDPDALTTGTCVGSFVRVCAATPPTTAYNFNNATSIDTTACTGYLVQSQGPGALSLCVIYGQSITIGTTFTAHGSRPLVLAATDFINVSGVLDVSSSSARATTGAGAGDPACGMPQAGQPGTTGNGGGAGGSQHGEGGIGGASNGGAVATAAAQLTTFTHVIGGCPGAKGGGALGGPPGDGGGAVMLIATNQITIGNLVDASGAGGGGATSTDGGGGGGTGGFIGLDSAVVHVSGHAIANGGAGGGGGGVSGGSPGADGGTDATAAMGGAGGTTGGDGGDGSTTISGGDGNSGTSGGGGGGAGAGLILCVGHKPDNVGLYSPACVVQ